MSKEINIKWKPEYGNLFQYAEKVNTQEGNKYLKLPFWIQKLPNGDFILYEEPPKDLSQFLTKAGLGGDNPQPKKVKL